MTYKLKIFKICKTSFKWPLEVCTSHKGIYTPGRESLQVSIVWGKAREKFSCYPQDSQTVIFNVLLRCKESELVGEFCLP